METADTIHLDLPAAYGFLSVVGACIGELLANLEGIRDPEGSTYAVQLAVHEACTNIIDHAYEGRPPGRIHMTFLLGHVPPRIVVELADTGRSFDPASVPLPNLEGAQEHGYGLFLIRQLMDEVAYEPAEGGNRWRLVKNLG